MQEDIITKEKVKELMAIKGEVRGFAIKDDISYIHSKFGQEGVDKIEAEMRKLGFPIKYSDIKQMGFYPVGLAGVPQLVIKKLFNFDEQEFYKMGFFNARLPIPVRLFLRYFLSLRILADHGQELWRKYYRIGNYRASDINEKEGYVISIIDDFDITRTVCHTISGFLAGLVQMTINHPTTGKETKCTFLGDDHHEFLVKWEVKK